MPHVFGGLIADAVRSRGTYDVTVHDMLVDGWPREQRYDAAITSMPVSGEIADVVIELPESLDQPLRIRAHDVTVELPVHLDRPIDDALDALDRFVLGGESVRPSRPPGSSP